MSLSHYFHSERDMDKLPMELPIKQCKFNPFTESGWGKIAEILQTTFSNENFLKKCILIQMLLKIVSKGMN